MTKMCHRQKMKYFMLSIIPSEDIVLKIMQIRTLIFQEFGLVSSRCLPVMIPVAYIPVSVNREQFRGLTLPAAVCNSVYKTIEGSDIYLQIRNNDFTSEIERRILNGMDHFKTSGFIDLHTGFYLATADKKSALKEVHTFINSKIEKTLIWKKNSLELIRIETMNDIWWENIRWETVWEEKIRPAG